MTTKKNIKNKSNFIELLGKLVLCLVVIIVISIFLTSENSNHRQFSTDTPYEKYEGSSHGDTFQVKVEDNITGEKRQYNINNISASTKQMESLSNISSSNKNYVKQNSTLVQQASKAYGFIISTDYKTIKYCSQYYPVNNLKRKFDSVFKDKKTKAVKILNNAFGPSGAKNLETSMMSNSSLIQTFHKQMEDDYQSVKRLATQDGIPNFTRKEYCKMIDESADEAAKDEYNKFKMVIPGF